AKAGKNPERCGPGQQALALRSPGDTELLLVAIDVAESLHLTRRQTKQHGDGAQFCDARQLAQPIALELSRGCHRDAAGPGALGRSECSPTLGRSVISVLLTELQEGRRRFFCPA